jgi:hypothetical protein
MVSLNPIRLLITLKLGMMTFKNRFNKKKFLEKDLTVMLSNPSTKVKTNIRTLCFS